MRRSFAQLKLTRPPRVMPAGARGQPSVGLLRSHNDVPNDPPTKGPTRARTTGRDRGANGQRRPRSAVDTAGLCGRVAWGLAPWLARGPEAERLPAVAAGREPEACPCAAS